MERTRILVADDSGMYADLLRRFVSSQPDLEVVAVASDGREAVRLATLLQPDLVLMDLRMPDVDGLAATRALAESARPVKVIAMTAHHSHDSEKRSLEAGAVAFLNKAEVDQRLIELIHSLTRPNLGSDTTNEAMPPGP